MKVIRIHLPVIVALIFGWLTLIGLLFWPELGNVILGWAALLAAAALILGVANLALVHLKRARGNYYSIALLVSMLLVFALAISDALGLTDNYVEGMFALVQAPLEAALASLLAFFLLFIGFRLLKKRRTLWSVLFLLSALFMLIARGPLPAGLHELVDPARQLFETLFVSAGVRGILIGVALGAITLGVRLLIGMERPYNK
jgi:predicted permease